MYYLFTDGTVLDAPERCGYCGITTGGGHQWTCPAFPPSLQEYIQSGIRILKYDDKGNFVKEL